MPMTSKEMIKLLKKNKFIIVNQNGSHVKMTNPHCNCALSLKRLKKRYGNCNFKTSRS